MPQRSIHTPDLLLSEKEQELRAQEQLQHRYENQRQKIKASSDEGGSSIRVEMKKGDHEKTRKVRDLVSGNVGMTNDKDGNLESVSVDGHIGTKGKKGKNSIGAGAGGKLNLKTGDVAVHAEANAGVGKAGMSLDTNEKSGSLYGEIDLGMLSAGGKISGTKETGLTTNVKGSLATFEVEYENVSKGTSPNTKLTELRVSFGPEDVLKTTVTFENVVTTEGNPLHVDGKITVLKSKRTFEISALGETQFLEIEKGVLQNNGKMKREVVEQQQSKTFANISENIHGGIDVIGTPSEAQRNARDHIEKSLKERFKDSGPYGPSDRLIESATNVAVTEHAKNLQDPKMKNVTEAAIEAGIYNNLNEQVMARQKLGADAPPEKHNKAAIKKGIDLAKQESLQLIESLKTLDIDARKELATQAQAQVNAVKAEDLRREQGVQLPDDIAEAYAQQGIVPEEAAQHVVTLVSEVPFGLDAARQGLTVDEARAIYSVAEGKPVENLKVGGTARIAAERYLTELERSGGNADAAMGYAREGLAEARMYEGPARDVSPEESMSVEELRAQLQRNEALRKERQKQAGQRAAATRAQDAQLQDQLSKMLGDAKTARSVWDGTTRERTANPAYRSQYTDAIGWANDMLNGKSSRLSSARPANTNQSYPTTPELAGRLLDRTSVNRMMSTPAYSNRSHPQHANVTKSVKSFYEATYADNKPDAPTRNTVAEEPSRMVDMGIAVQQETDRRQVAQARADQQAAQAKAQEDQEHSAQLQADEQKEQANLTAAQPTRARKAEKLGESVTAPNATLGGAPLATAKSTEEALTTPAQTETVIGPLGAVEVPKSRVRAEDGGGKSANNGSRPTKEALYKNKSNSGALGKGGYYETKDKYISGTNSKGLSTGGSKLDTQGREIGAYGQFTRDIMGRTGSGSDGAGSNTRVICTELVRQGFMAPALQRLDIAFTLKRLSPATVRGYHAWAVPYVRLMKRSNLATRVMEPIARWRAEEIAYQLGERVAPCWPGKAVRLVMEPSCWLLGTVLGWFGDPDRFAAKIAKL